MTVSIENPKNLQNPPKMNKSVEQGGIIQEELTNDNQM